MAFWTAQEGMVGAANGSRSCCRLAGNPFLPWQKKRRPDKPAAAQFRQHAAGA
jgi:hypothetical protein